MKCKKLLSALLMIVFVPLLTTGCLSIYQRTYDYSFAQPLDQVEKVEICKYNYYTSTTTPLLVLDESQANALLTDIDALPCKKHFGDSPMDYGEAVVYITYSNGEAEVIGIWNVAKVDISGNWHIGVEYFDRKELCPLLLQYVPELLPELQKYLD